MKQKSISIFLLFFFLLTEAKASKRIIITTAITKSKAHHRFILPVVAGVECATSLYALIPILITTLGNIHFCLPAEPEIALEKIRNKLTLQ